MKNQLVLLGAGVTALIYFSKVKDKSVVDSSLNFGATANYSSIPETKYVLPSAGIVYKEIINSTTEKYSLPAGLLGRLLQQESYFNPYAHNIASNARGIAQIVTRWHPTVNDPFDPIESIKYAGKYLRELFDHFGHWDLTLAAYNWGWGNLDKNIEQYGVLGFNNMPTETKNYVKQILQDI